MGKKKLIPVAWEDLWILANTEVGGCWSKFVQHTNNVPKHAFTLWLIMKHRLMIESEEVAAWNWDNVFSAGRKGTWITCFSMLLLSAVPHCFEIGRERTRLEKRPELLAGWRSIIQGQSCCYLVTDCSRISKHIMKEMQKPLAMSRRQWSSQ